MTFQCPKLDKDKHESNRFHDECGNKVFLSARRDWDPVKKTYFDHINSITDPILRHISIYFVQYYIDGYNYFHSSHQTERNGACQYLNRWLQKKKDLFTYGKKCQTKIELWKNAIETLWVMLKKEYTIPNTKERSPWCNESSISLTTIYPREFTPLNCDETISREPISKDSCPPSVPAKCECESPETAFPVIPSLPDQPSEKDPTKNIAVTSGFTAAGTLGTLFFLYRFTPMSSWLRRRGMNNVGTDLYMDPGAAESFLRMQHDNGGNNLFYHPSV